MNVLQQIGAFLIESLFSLYIGAVILRMLLGYAGANFYNPLSQFLVKVTNPVLVPLRRFIPSIGKIDTAAVVLALGLTVIKTILLLLIGYGDFSLVAALIYSIIDLIKVVIWVYIISLIIQAVMSWVGSAHGNPVAPLIQSLTDPLLRPIRRVVPTIGALDLSPMVALLLLNILLIIVRNF
ncbi:MAG TPA: YggT family protein [Leucothrix mucor]|uniref:YggT family protein n=1 Tax=Leucothrix mucor TaxID=45248 RepID=A0A7V2WUI4_LEUMU|nr:YggT family protein [Leucothrix mucor]